MAPEQVMTANPKPKSVFVALLLPVACWAQDWRDPNAKFSTKANRTEKLVVSWMVVPTGKVQATCEAISKDSGLGGFGFAVDACSFWQKKTCLIVTGDKSTHAEAGHEIRHCFQGSFH
jgi:hypothetical protein